MITTSAASTLRQRAGALLRRLVHEHSSTPRLSVAVGVGAFIGSTPFFGFHTPIAVLLSRVLRLNVFATTLGSQVSLPFFAPFLVYACVQVGHFCLAGEWLDISKAEIDLAFAKSFFSEWLLGSAIVGPTLAIAMAAITFSGLSIARAKRSTSGERWSGRSRGTGLGYAIFFHTVGRLGRRGGYALLYFVTLYYFLFAWKGRRHSADFFRRVVGPRGFFEGQRDRWRHFHTFGKSIIDRLLMMAGGASEFTFEHENVERILGAHGKGKGVVLLSAHFGSWAIASEQLGGVQPTLVVYENEARSIREFFERHQSKSPPKLVILNEGPTAVLDVLRALREGEIVAMLADRNRPNSPSIRVLFFGEPAEFPLGPFMVGVVSGAPIVLTFSTKEGPTHHHFFALESEEVGPVARSDRDRVVREKVEWYVRELEKLARAHPYQWYNFYDFWA